MILLYRLTAVMAVQYCSLPPSGLVNDESHPDGKGRAGDEQGCCDRQAGGNYFRSAVEVQLESCCAFIHETTLPRDTGHHRGKGTALALPRISKQTPPIPAHQERKTAWAHPGPHCTTAAVSSKCCPGQRRKSGVGGEGGEGVCLGEAGRGRMRLSESNMTACSQGS